MENEEERLKKERALGRTVVTYEGPAPKVFAGGAFGGGMGAAIGFLIGGL